MTEQRKLIKLGNSSFAIALPKEWIDKSGLKKGDNIFVEQNSSGELNIMAKYLSTNSTKTKDFDFLDKEDLAIQIELISAYDQDYNLFKIKKSVDKGKINYVKELVKNLLSFEIIEETKDYILFKDVFNIEEANIDNFIRRMDNILRSMFEELATYFKKGGINQKQCEELYNADREITRLYLFIERMFIKALNNPAINNILKMDIVRLLNNREISSDMEKMGDEIKRIARLLKGSLKDDESKKISAIFEKTHNNYLNCFLSYHKKDKEKLYSVIESSIGAIKECDKLSKEQPGNVAKIIEKIKQINFLIFQASKKMIYITC